MPPEIPQMMAQPGNLIHYRIGPIFDEAYLKNIDPAIIREITLITARAELAAAHAQVQALESVVKLIETAKIGR